jgi:hypothetical protein
MDADGDRRALDAREWTPTAIDVRWRLGNGRRRRSAGVGRSGMDADGDRRALNAREWAPTAVGGRRRGETTTGRPWRCVAPVK